MPMPSWNADTKEPLMKDEAEAQRVRLDLVILIVSKLVAISVIEHCTQNIQFLFSSSESSVLQNHWLPEGA